MFPSVSPKSKNRRGAVMSEMVLALPFFFLVLSLILFLGRGVMRLQESHVVDRYEAWRQAAVAPGPQVTPDGRTDPLNKVFFQGQNDSLDCQADDYYPSDVMQSFSDTICAVSDDANNLMTEQVPNLDQGRRVVFTTHFSVKNAIWARLNHPASHGHVRIGTEWKFANGWDVDSQGKVKPGGDGTHIDEAINKVFMKPLDDQLNMVGKLGMPIFMATSLQGLYMDLPEYVGPDYPPPIPSQ